MSVDQSLAVFQYHGAFLCVSLRVTSGLPAIVTRGDVALLAIIATNYCYTRV